LDGNDQPNAERADDLPVRRVCETALFREFSLEIKFQMLIAVPDLICLHLFETANSAGFLAQSSGARRDNFS
jgi:hypothetical protein